MADAATQKAYSVLNLLLAGLVVTLAPYALFGKKRNLAAWIAFLNGVLISLSLAFVEPLFLLPNPLIALVAISPLRAKKHHASR